MSSGSSVHVPDELPTPRDRFACDARFARIVQAIFAVLLLLCSAGDALSAVRLWNLDTSVLAIHEVDGWIDYARVGKARTPVIRVSTAEGGVVALTCPIRAFARYRVCPSAAPSWNGRQARLQWVDIPTGWSGASASRALRLRADDELLFEARASDVVRADLSANVFGIIVALAIFCPIMLLVHAIERLSRRKSAEIESRIVAVRRRHASDGQ